MGGAMISAVNDYTALDWNPAALTLLGFSEMGISLSVQSHSSDARYLNINRSADISTTNMNSFGIGIPIATSRGHLAFGLSYDRIYDFTNIYTFKAVNGNSSFLNTRGFLNDPGWQGRSLDKQLEYLDKNNLAWGLYLTYNVDSANRNLVTPLQSGLQQSGTVTNEGGLGVFRFGAGIDVAENVAAGGTLNVFTGTRDYRKFYREEDINNLFPDTTALPPLGFRSANIIDTRTSSITGVNLKLGFFTKPSENFDFGLTIETPTIYTIEDRFMRTGSSEFSTGSYNSKNTPSLEEILIHSYDITTPLRAGMGAAVHFGGLTLSGSVEYSDMSQLRFSSNDFDLGDLNDAARDRLTTVIGWRVGGEYIIKPAKLSIRGGYRVDPSPYKDDPREFDVKTLSLGTGFVVGTSTMIEISYQRQSYHTSHTIYNDLTQQGEQVSAVVDKDAVVRGTVLVSFGFRF